jgi:hypothetical protein
MIRAETKKWARIVFNPYEEFLLKRNFTNFYVTTDFPAIDTNKSLIITPNHISWWDGFFVDYAARIFLDKKFYIMMLEEQLVKYPFFSKLGAFSINPGLIKSVSESLKYAADIIQDKNNLLVFYPQGSIEPFDKAADLKPGLLALLNSNEDISILPTAFRIEYSSRKKPAIFFRPGKILSSLHIKEDFNLFRYEFNTCLENLRCDIHDNNIKGDLFTGDFSD